MLLGDYFVFYKRLNKLGWGDVEWDQLDTELVSEYTKASASSPLYPRKRTSTDATGMSA
jgi:hypothetical protein